MPTCAASDVTTDAERCAQATLEFITRSSSRRAP